MVVFCPGFDVMPQPTSVGGVSGDGNIEAIKQALNTDREYVDETREGKVYTVHIQENSNCHNI